MGVCLDEAETEMLLGLLDPGPGGQGSRWSAAVGWQRVRFTVSGLNPAARHPVVHGGAQPCGARFASGPAGPGGEWAR